MDPETLSARLTQAGGRLIAPAHIAGAVAKVGRQFTLRGVEATVAGTLERRGAELILRLPSGDLLALRRLERKVQWDARRKRLGVPTAEERGAFGRLSGGEVTVPVTLEVTGPLVQIGSGDLTLEVRTFKVDPPDPIVTGPGPAEEEW